MGILARFIGRKRERYEVGCFTGKVFSSLGALVFAEIVELKKADLINIKPSACISAAIARKWIQWEK